MMLRLAADMIDHQNNRANFWFNELLRTVEAEYKAFSLAEKLVEMLVEAGHPQAAQALTDYEDAIRWRDDHRRQSRTGGGGFDHYSGLR